MFTDEALVGNESLKTFASPDDLGKAYLDLHGKVSTGDVSIINEELRKDPNIAKFKNVNDIAKSYVEVSKLVGTIKHAPGKPEEYKFTQFKDLHPGLKVDGLQKFLAGQLHGLDIDNDRSDKLQQAVILALDKGLKANDEAKKVKGLEVETALRGEWKGDYDKNKDNVTKILEKAGFGDMAKSLSGDPVALKAMHQITSLLSEDSVGRLGESGAQNITEKTAANKRIQEMITKQEHMKPNEKGVMVPKVGPEYDKFLEEWKRMNDIAAGGA
jgi:hypothetical protein